MVNKNVCNHKLSLPLYLLTICIIIVIPLELLRTHNVVNIVLELSYGIISGVIIFFLTVKYPEMMKKKRFEADINSAIDDLAILLLRSLFEVNHGNLTLLSDREQWRTSMYSRDWNQHIQVGPHIGCTVFKSLHIEFEKLQKQIVLIETVYKDVLSDEVNSALMQLYNSDVFSLVDDFSRAQTILDFKSNNDNRSIFVDRIFDLLDNFEKVSMLVSNRERSGFDENDIKITWPR